MDSETLIESNEPTKPEPASENRSGGWRTLIAVAAVIAAACAGKAVGVAMADRNWENLLVATRLADPDVAARVVNECWSKRDEFRKAADANRKIFEAAEIVRKGQVGGLVSKPASVGQAPVPSKVPATPNTEPKREAP